MAVLSLNRVGGDSMTLAQGFKDSDTIPFVARCDRPDEPRINIYSHPECPKRYQQHPENPRLFCLDVTATRRKSKYLFDIQANYSSEIELPERDENPLARPADVSVVTRAEQVLTQRDGEGRPMLTTAGEPFAPTEDLEPHSVLTVEKNAPPVLPAWLDQYVGAVNLDPIRIGNRTWPKETLRIMSLAVPKPQTENRVRFCPLTLEIHHRYDGWWYERLNKGWYELQERTETDDQGRERKVKSLVRIMVSQADGYAPEEVFIDKDGAAYRETNGKLKAKLDPKDIIILKFPRGRRLPFSALNSVLR